MATDQLQIDRTLAGDGAARRGGDDMVVITPDLAWRITFLRDVWQYRELLWNLSKRDLIVRYKQTALGVLWVVLQPLILMVIYSLIFGRVANLRETTDVPYPLFAFAGLLPWLMFSRAMGEASLSLTANVNLLKKIYFPRVLLPVSPILTSLVDFGITFLLLLGVMAWYGVAPGWSIVLLPVFLLLAIITSLAVGLWLSAINVIYRDVRHIVPFLTQVWMLLSPVVYPVTVLPEKWHVLYGLNPMAGVIGGFRWALLGSEPPSPWLLITSSTVVVVLLVGGLYNFQRMEARFADVA